MARRKGYTPKKKEEVSLDAIEAQPTPIATVKKPNRLPYFLVFAIGFLLYANTIPFDYALDDKLYITSNTFTKKGLDGLSEIWTNDLMTGFFGSKKNLVEGGRYRPLALTTHAIEWELFEENPEISHFINVVLYGLIGVVLLSVLRMIFGWKEERWWWSIPFVATLLYLAHPLHTEVAANIKSRDEIMSLLFGLLAFQSVLNYLKKKNQLSLALGGVWFVLSLFSKESSITFLGVIPLALVFYPKGSLKESAVALSPLIGFTLLYLAIRLSVFADQGASLEVAQELMNKPYLNATDDERLASIFFTMGLYLKLLVWPHPLTHDYYPFHPFRTYDELMAGVNPYIEWSNSWAVLSVAAYVLILGYGMFTLYKRIKGGPPDIIGFGLLIFFGTFILFSNLFFDIGAFMNERFLFIPSLGFCLILAHLLIRVVGSKMGEKAGVVLFAVIMLGYSVKTIARNYAWENDRSLATTDVVTSDGSAKVKMTMGSETLEMAKETTNEAERQRLLKQAEQYCMQSLKIYPQYFPPLDIIGNVYYEMGNYPYSVHYFIQAARKKSDDARILSNLEAVANMAAQKNDHESAIKAYTALRGLYSGNSLSRVYASLGEIYGRNLNDMNRAKSFLHKAIKADPDNAAAYQKIGIVYAMTNQRDSAMYNFNRSLELDPENARVYLNLGILYNQMGDTQRGQEYMQQAMKLDPSIGQGEN